MYFLVSSSWLRVQLNSRVGLMRSTRHPFPGTARQQPSVRNPFSDCPRLFWPVRLHHREAATRSQGRDVAVGASAAAFAVFVVGDAADVLPSLPLRFADITVDCAGAVVVAFDSPSVVAFSWTEPSRISVVRFQRETPQRRSSVFIELTMSFEPQT